MKVTMSEYGIELITGRGGVRLGLCDPGAVMPAPKVELLEDREGQPIRTLTVYAAIEEVERKALYEALRSEL